MELEPPEPADEVDAEDNAVVVPVEVAAASNVELATVLPPLGIETGIFETVVEVFDPEAGVDVVVLVGVVVEVVVVDVVVVTGAIVVVVDS